MAPILSARPAKPRARRVRRTAPPGPVRAEPAPGPLGRMSARAFLRQHWQKRPLLVREAVPDTGSLLTLPELFALAQREDVESRLVQRDGPTRWSLAHGPFDARFLRRLPARNWTLLVQGVNLHVRAADALLRRFDFVPFARLDDLMVSYAAPGGGVGPHLDAYDVFLVQGFGRRRWRFGAPIDRSLRPGVPLKILRRFVPQHDEIVNPGDLLYLPPDYAHDGVALEACTTYSVGFRAPSGTELGGAFLGFLQDELSLPGRYADPELVPTQEPARVDATMVRKTARILNAVRWTKVDVARFLGTWLSEPKPTVFFDRPERPLALAAFAQRARRRGLELDLRTQMLYDDRSVFVNGTANPWPRAGRALLQRLANRRRLAASELASAPATLVEALHDWYSDGYLRIA